MQRIAAAIVTLGLATVGLMAAATQRDELAGTGNENVIEAITGVAGVSMQVLAWGAGFAGVAALLLVGVTILKRGAA